MPYPDSIDTATSMKRGIFRMPSQVTIVFAGDADAAHSEAERWWGAVYEPTHGRPTLDGRPLFTTTPVIVCADDPIATVRSHHDAVIAPAVRAGRSIFCVGAWWRDPTVVKLTQGMPLTAWPTAWPEVGRMVTVDIEPSTVGGGFEMLGNDHVRLTGTRWSDRVAGLSGALYELGLTVAPWDISRRQGRCG